MASKKLNLVNFKKVVLDFTVKYLCCGRCYALIEDLAALQCQHLFCAGCRTPDRRCPSCGAGEVPSVEPLADLVQIFNSLQGSLGIDQKVREKCFHRIYPAVASVNQQVKENQHAGASTVESARPDGAPLPQPIDQTAEMLENQEYQAKKQAEVSGRQEAEANDDMTELPSGKLEPLASSTKLQDKLDDDAQTACDGQPPIQQEDPLPEADRSATELQRRQSIKRKTQLEERESSDQSSPDSGKVVDESEQSSKRTRRPSAKLTAEADAEQSPKPATVRKRATAKRPAAKPQPEEADEVEEVTAEKPTRTPRVKKEKIAGTDEDEQFKKPPLKSALKAKRPKDSSEPAVKSTLARKISFAKGSARASTDSIESGTSIDSKSETTNGAPKSDQLVLLSSNINEEQLRQLKRFEKRFRCRLLTDYEDSVTHFVTSLNEEQLGNRTLKYLMALLGHKFLLGFDWIVQSLDAGKLMDEVAFEMRGTTKQVKSSLGAPRLSREQRPKIFDGRLFYLDGKFSTGGFPDKENFRRLIELGGGQLLETQPQLKVALKEQLAQVRFVIDPQNTRSKFLQHPQHILGSDLLNAIMELRFD